MAERDVEAHPSTSLFQIRKFVDRMTVLICLREGLEDWEDKDIKERIDDHLRGVLPGRIVAKLHRLRIEGNKGAHENDDLLSQYKVKNRSAADDPDVARRALKDAEELGAWFCGAYGKSFSGFVVRLLGRLFMIFAVGAVALIGLFLLVSLSHNISPDVGGQYKPSAPTIRLRMSVYVPAQGSSAVVRFNTSDIITFDLQNIAGIRMRDVETGEVVIDCNSAFNGTPLNGTSYQSFRTARPVAYQFVSCRNVSWTVYIYRAWCGAHLC